MIALPNDAALLLIDIQRGFEDAAYWGPRNNPRLEENVAALLAAWRATGRPVIHVRHMSTTPGSPLRPGQPGNDFMEAASPLGDEPIVEKSVNSAFIGTDLEERLRGAGIGSLVVAGLTTNHCVSTTTRMAGNLGFDTWLVGDATASFDRRGPDGMLHPAEQVHAVSLASLHEEFATVVDTAEVLERVRAR